MINRDFVKGVSVRFLRRYKAVIGGKQRSRFHLQRKQYTFTTDKELKMGDVFRYTSPEGNKVGVVVVSTFLLTKEEAIQHKMLVGKRVAKQYWDFKHKRLWNQPNPETGQKKLWVKVELPSQKVTWYQLSKDLQYTFAPAKSIETINRKLLGALINVPLTPYNDRGRTKIVSAKIIKVVRCSAKVLDSARITRSQFHKFNCETDEPQSLRNGVIFLQHDYPAQVKKHITESVIFFEPEVEKAITQFAIMMTEVDKEEANGKD